MARRWKLGLLGAALSAGAAACATLAGLGEYQEGNPPVDASVGDGAIAADVSTDAGIDVPQLAPCGAGYLCFETVPNWVGPFEVSENPNGPGAKPPGCPDGGPPQDKGLSTDLVVPDASCGCTCQTQATCAANFQVSNGTSCVDPPTCGQQFIGDGGCIDLSCSNPNVAVEALLADATCTFTTVADIPEAGFARNEVSCAAVTVDSGACEAGTLCTAPPGDGFGLGLCIRHEGEQTCPDASPYAYQHVYYQGFNDGRLCGPCDCSVTQDPACAYSFLVYSAQGCGTGGEGTLPLSAAGSCQSKAFTSPPRSMGVNIPQPSQPGACATDGGGVEGEAGPDPTYAVTYCCTQ